MSARFRLGDTDFYRAPIRPVIDTETGWLVAYVVVGFSVDAAPLLDLLNNQPRSWIDALIKSRPPLG